MNPADDELNAQAQHAADILRLQEQLLQRMPEVPRHALQRMLLSLAESPADVRPFESGLAQGYILAAQQRHELSDAEAAALCAFVQELRDA